MKLQTPGLVFLIGCLTLDKLDQLRSQKLMDALKLITSATSTAGIASRSPMVSGQRPFLSQELRTSVVAVSKPGPGKKSLPRWKKEW
jgi:hypothetical protein